MTNDFLVRRYQPDDEEAVREICFETAMLGSSMAPYFDDVWLVSEVLVGCYFRFEPQSLFVAVADGRVIGYLSGCLDSDVLMRNCRNHLLASVLPHLFLSGHIVRPKSWKLARFAVRHARAALPLKKCVQDSHPAHLHLNIASTCRGHGVGRALMDAFLSYASAAHSPGVHLSTASAKARDFFARSGFHMVAAAEVATMKKGKHHSTYLMTKEFGVVGQGAAAPGLTAHEHQN